MLIRTATLDDFEALYTIGKDTPELKVSGVEDFILHRLEYLKFFVAV